MAVVCTGGTCGQLSGGNDRTGICACQKNLRKAAFDSESICTFEAEMCVNEKMTRLYEVAKGRNN